MGPARRRRRTGTRLRQYGPGTLPYWGLHIIRHYGPVCTAVPLIYTISPTNINITIPYLGTGRSGAVAWFRLSLNNGIKARTIQPPPSDVWPFLRFRRHAGVSTNSRGASFALGIPAGRGNKRVVEPSLSENPAHRRSREKACDEPRSPVAHTHEGEPPVPDGRSAVCVGPASLLPAGILKAANARPNAAGDTRATMDMHPPPRARGFGLAGSIPSLP